jgi:transposase
VNANALLSGLRGILQCDGYAAYKKVAGRRSANSSITLAFCWSHVRRGFYDLAKTNAPIAVGTLKPIAAIYEIEEWVRGKSAADRLPCARPRANLWSQNCASGSPRRGIARPPGKSSEA